MAEHVAAIEDLQKLPEGVHIFCARLPGDGTETSSKADSKERRDRFFSALPLLAYDGEECVPFHKWLYETLDAQLSQCDECIREYHMGKIDFKNQLLQEYDEDEVQQFLNIILRRDIDRIQNGLDSVTKKLEPLPREQRSPRELQNSQLFAFYETLHCEAFYNNEQLLVKHFDTPFALVQTLKELKIKEILPAITKFLFCANQLRLDWAVRTWKRLNRDIDDQEWDWAVKNIIISELNAIQSEVGLIRFWTALRVIIAKLSPDQVAVKLFDLGFNFARLSLDHLAKKTMALPHITASLKILWSKAPDAYWQALPSVSAVTIAEQFFSSHFFDKCLEIQAGPDDKSGAMDVTSWMAAFLSGLSAANRPPATRTLTSQLFQRANISSLSRPAKQLCFQEGVKCLLTMILSFSEDETARNTAGRAVLVDALGLVSSHLSAILSFDKAEPADSQLATHADVMSLVRNSLGLECIILKQDYEALTKPDPKPSESSYNPDLWQAINTHLRADSTDLSMAFLKGTMSLVGLEQIPLRSDAKYKDAKHSFNEIFSKVEDLVSQSVDKIAEFPAKHLDVLFSMQDINMALMALLFSGNDRIYQATVEMIKNIAQEPGRVEALSHVLDAFFSNTLYSLCWIFRRLAHLGPFKPIPRLLSTGKDFMDLLCDTTGLLRTRKLDQREISSVQAFWQYSWLILTTIFRRMETWSVEVPDKPLMTEVCRNTMQYAQDLFGHYYVFVKVLSESKHTESSSDISAILLNTDSTSTSGSPPKALDFMVKWLRLRDPYLAETLVNLITGMLTRLREYGTTIPDDRYSLSFVEEVAISGSGKGMGIRTILNDNQKAALIRALEQYTGKQIARPVQVRQQKKQQRLDLESWSDSNKGKIKQEIIEIEDDDASSSTKIERKELAMAEKLRRQALLTDKKESAQHTTARSSIPSRPAGPSREELIRQQQASKSKAFIEERKRQEAAAKAKKAELAARVRGTAGSEHTANAGSGLSHLGVQGKDHAAPRSDLMVSSGSESESDSEEELFGTAKPGVGSASVGARRNVRGLAPTKKIKQVRSAKDMRARLSPDLTGLHKTILGWDFFADSETPPNSGKEDYTLITNTFKTVQEYQKTFEPLLILESWQSFRQAREEGSFKPFEVKIANSMVVDNFYEINSTIPMSEGKELGLGPSDVVLLSKGTRPHVEPNEPHCFARVKEITRKRGEVQIVYRVNSSNNPMRSHLNDKATIYATVITNLTPLEREYGALMALPYYDLVEEVIRAQPSPLLDYRDEEVEGIKELHNLNTAQAKAVKSAVDNDAFTLVQGPPGSGKTKTITAILSEIIAGMTAGGKPSMRSADTFGPPPSNKKVLVAAPSNAAVDELVMRFKDGIRVVGGRTQKINVVRLGRSEAINSAVKDVTLEELVNARLEDSAGANGSTNGKSDIHAIMMEHKSASDQMNELRHKMDETRQQGKPVTTADDQLFESLKRKKTTLSAQIDQMREKQNSASRDADINRRRIEQDILDSAHVLCATLSGSGHEKIQSLNVEFETVIIDEAAQSIELSALIPLKYGCSKCILVGDPKQLPPTVLSRQAAKYQYEQSLFARMEINHKKDVHLLDIQYRMHPEISAFPSRTFYDSRLRDGGDMARLRARPWHRSQTFAPYRFFDVEGMHESAPKGRSLVNNAEINVALAMYERLRSDVPRYDFRGKIGIITPYKGQLKALKNRFSARYGETILTNIDFNTTDAFQGRESEIIIFSCVRASTKGIGFLNDVRRMNVGLTRAKCSLWVLGNSTSLVQGEFWRALVKDAKDRSLYTDGNILKIFERQLLTSDMMRDDVDMESADSAALAQDKAGTSLETEAEHKESDATPQQNSKAPSTATSRNTPTTSTSGTSSPDRLGSISRPSSVNSASRDKPDSGKSNTNGVGNRNKTNTAIRSSLGTALDGPSGGRFGLNSKVNCGVCGSDRHFSHNCDNRKAKEAHLGQCNRCGEAGHAKTTCTASRCLTCGGIGHVETECKIDDDQKLSPAEKEEVQRQENKHQSFLKENREKLARKQLGEHGASIPAIRTMAPDPPSDIQVKRKRERSADGITTNKSIKTDTDLGGRSSAPPSGPTPMKGPTVNMGPAGGPRTGGAPLVRKKRDDAGSMFAKRR